MTIPCLLSDKEKKEFDAIQAAKEKGKEIGEFKRIVCTACGHDKFFIESDRVGTETVNDIDRGYESKESIRFVCKKCHHVSEHLYMGE